MAALSIWDYAEDRVVPRMNAYRAIYPGPQRQTNAPAPVRTELGAMAYTELGSGTVAEHEAVQSTVLNRIASGHRYYAHGEELNEHNVIHAPHQYQGVARFPDRFTKYLEGTAPLAQNAAQAEQNLMRTGKPTTNATAYIAHLDGSPPSDEEVWRLGDVQKAEPYRVGRVYLYAPKPPAPRKK